MHLVQLITTVVLLLIHWSAALSCIHFEYVEQPSDRLQAELPCNPYNNHNQWRLKLRCIVEQRSSALYTGFDIHWFQNTSSGVVLDHGRPGTVLEEGNKEQVIFGEQWLNMPARDEYLGEYWCQVVATSKLQEGPVYLSKSNSILVHEPMYYSPSQFERVCVDIIRSSDLRCSDTVTSTAQSNTTTTSPNTTQGITTSSAMHDTSIINNTPIRSMSTSVLCSTDACTVSVVSSTSSIEMVDGKTDGSNTQSKALVVGVAVGAFVFVFSALHLFILIAIVIYRRKQSAKDKKIKVDYNSSYARNNSVMLELNRAYSSTSTNLERNPAYSSTENVSTNNEPDAVKVYYSEINELEATGSYEYVCSPPTEKTKNDCIYY